MGVNETNLGSSSMDWGRNFSTPSGNAFDSFERKDQMSKHEIKHICAYNTKLWILTEFDSLGKYKQIKHYEIKNWRKRDKIIIIRQVECLSVMDWTWDSSSITSCWVLTTDDTKPSDQLAYRWQWKERMLMLRSRKPSGRQKWKHKERNRDHF